MTRILTVAQTVWLELLRKKDVYVLLILLGALLVVLVSLNVFGLGGVIRYVADTGFLAAWLFGWILAVNVSSRQLPQEETSGTIFPLLAKPITRFELIMGKWLGATGTVCLAVLAFYFLVAGVIAGRGGTIDPLALLQGYALHAVALAVISSIGLAFSTRMHSDAAATMSYVLTAASFVVVPRIPEFVARETGATAGALVFLYNLLPHLEVFDLRKRIVHDYGPAPCGTFLWTVLYGLLLVALFLLASWLTYRGKRFSRAALG